MRLAEFREAIRIRPEGTVAHTNLAFVTRSTRNVPEGYEEALVHCAGALSFRRRRGAALSAGRSSNIVWDTLTESLAAAQQGMIFGWRECLLLVRPGHGLLSRWRQGQGPRIVRQSGRPDQGGCPERLDAQPTGQRGQSSSVDRARLKPGKEPEGRSSRRAVFDCLLLTPPEVGPSLLPRIDHLRLVTR